jgi:recombination protein U
MAKNPGKKFEEDFVKSIPDYCDITRLKDAGGWSNATNMRFTSKNPCDFIVYSSRGLFGKMYKLELKSTLGKSLPFTNIKSHQLKCLCESEEKLVDSGFVVNFRDVNETYFAEASAVWVYMQVTDRKSIPLNWFRDMTTQIQQTIIRVRWRYDLSWL